MIRIDVNRLVVAEAELGRSVASRIEKLQSIGRRDRSLGLPISLSSFVVGSWDWQRWAEGWAGEDMPTRSSEGADFNMTPADEVFGRAAWLRSKGLPEDQVAEAVAIFSQGYRPEVLAHGNG